MPLNPDAKTGIGSALKNGAASLAGFNQKAIIEIADFSDLKLVEKNAQKPSSGAGFGGLANLDLDIGFNLDAVKKFASAIGLGGDDTFELYGNVKKFRMECQFNPNELNISGYGGEEIPTQKFAIIDEKEKKGHPEGEGKDKKGPRGGSTMAAASTRIDMNFRIAFDKSNPQDAFFSDKFTLSQTNIAKGLIKGGLKAAGKSSNSVQPEVEALTAIVRNEKKRLVRFAWGDMSYEGVLNSVNAEYVMFNINGEPCRAFVSLGMVLYDAEVAGANTDIWQDEYMADFYKLKSGLISLKPSI